MLQVDQRATAFDVRERAVVFGPSEGLLGILTEPIGSPDQPVRSDQPAIVFINTGIIHRVGDNRVGTIWARRLAGAGRTVLRFDLSGIGDSERRQDSLSLLDSTLADMRAALNWLETHRHVHRFILIGTCMGADRALVYAGTDLRVVGTVLIDPTTPKTWRFYLRRYAYALLDTGSWQRPLTQWRLARKVLHRRWRKRAPGGGAERRYPEPLSAFLRTFFADAYRTAVAANVRILAVFTGGVAFRYNYRDQLTDAFPEIAFQDLLQLEYFDKKDHLISFEADRLELFAVTDAWLGGSVTPGAASVRATPGARPPPCLAPKQQCTEVEF